MVTIFYRDFCVLCLTLTNIIREDFQTNTRYFLGHFFKGRRGFSTDLRFFLGQFQMARGPNYEKYASPTGLLGPTGPTSIVGPAGPMSFAGLLSQMSVDAGWPSL